MRCDEWSNLFKRYRQSVVDYLDAVDRISAEFGADFTTAWQRAETARRRSCDCRNALLAHQRYHACSSEEPIAVLHFAAAAAGGGTEDMVLGDQGQAGG